jgi:thioesterase domain-containing protein
VGLIRRVQPQGPYLLMGWCVAGALAFEIARQLKDAGKDVSHLFLIDSWVPRYWSRQPPVRALIGKFTLFCELIWADWRRAQTFSAFLLNRPRIQKLLRVLNWRKARDGAATESECTNLETYDQWLLQYLQAVTAKYEPRSFPIRITLLRSRQEPTGWPFHPLAGWGAFTSERVELRSVDGDHYTMFKNPGVTQMARHIAELIGGGELAHL